MQHLASRRFLQQTTAVHSLNRAINVQRDMKKLFIALLSLYTLMLAYLYLVQRSFIYFPDFTRPVALAPNYELENQGLLLKGWALNKEKNGAILYFGGNGESVEYNISQFSNLFPNQAVYMLSYRGYGESEGMPTEDGIYADALALYDKIRMQHKTISIIGRSLGSGVATYVAAHRETQKVVLITPFASIEELAKDKFPIFPIGMLLIDKYLSIEHAKKIDSEVLILYAGKDQVVPEDSTKRLVSSLAPDLTQTVKILDAGHNSISEYERYNRRLRDFFTSKSNLSLSKDN